MAHYLCFLSRIRVKARCLACVGNVLRAMHLPDLPCPVALLLLFQLEALNIHLPFYAPKLHICQRGTPMLWILRFLYPQTQLCVKCICSCAFIFYGLRTRLMVKCFSRICDYQRNQQGPALIYFSAYSRAIEVELTVYLRCHDCIGQIYREFLISIMLNCKQQISQ